MNSLFWSDNAKTSQERRLMSICRASRRIWFHLTDSNIFVCRFDGKQGVAYKSVMAAIKCEQAMGKLTRLPA